MATYNLNLPARAVRYEYGTNELPVKELVQSVRTGVSSTNGRGDRAFHFFNGGPDVSVHDGEWVVAIAGELLVLSHAAFRESFSAVVD
jgi:hypothetical protein